MRRLKKVSYMVEHSQFTSLKTKKTQGVNLKSHFELPTIQSNLNINASHFRLNKSRLLKPSQHNGQRLPPGLPSYQPAPDCLPMDQDVLLWSGIEVARERVSGVCEGN